ncbi:hypothetical protein TRSC58_00698 [Trypanosoma rangeli SC58]|uniref:Transmembrane protein n=1 Tax=Trypanosoma rangeli SC58 TaxID=429131 RepID=A0A061J803_TRYRA|nr:hypothetical protein TRSC58_00698 [Trypanosoma rangeli SC58]
MHTLFLSIMTFAPCLFVCFGFLVIFLSHGKFSFFFFCVEVDGFWIPMLRRCQRRFMNRGHLMPTPSKYSDRPGMWGPGAGPPKDTLARRSMFFRMLVMNKIGRLTRPLRTNRVRWIWRKTQLQLWKTFVMSMVFMCVILFGNIWLSFVYHAYTVGPTTPVLERKVREHRVSKQILQMVREREKEMVREEELEAAKQTIAAQKATE